MATQEPQKRGERTESRGAGGQQNKQHTAPRPTAPGAAKPEKARDNRGAERRRKKKKRKKNTNQGGRRKENQSAKAQGTRGRKPKEERDKGGARKTEHKEGKKKGRGGGQPKNHNRGDPSTEGAEQSRKTKRREEKMRRTKMRPRGRPARPGQEGRAHAHTHGTRWWRALTRKGRCRRPHETAPVHQPSPPSNDRRYGKLDASVTGSIHANHRSARIPRPTPEGPARDNPIAGAPNGYDAERAQRPCLGGGQRQAQ